jgi:hypothetical protein
LNAPRLSRIARSSSIQPFWAAAMIMAYSPETWKAKVGTAKASTTRRTMSR